MLIAPAGSDLLASTINLNLEILKVKNTTAGYKGLPAMGRNRPGGRVDSKQGRCAEGEGVCCGTLNNKKTKN